MFKHVFTIEIKWDMG